MSRPKEHILREGRTASAQVQLALEKDGPLDVLGQAAETQLDMILIYMRGMSVSDIPAYMESIQNKQRKKR